MPKFFIKTEQIEENNIKITGEDVNHIKNVLRMKKGNPIEICDNSCLQTYLCEISEIQKDCVICSVLENVETNRESNVKVTLLQGLPKADKMEQIIQKSVELGVYEIVPVQMKRCVVKLNEKDGQKKIQRWQKIAQVAAKQCKRDWIPMVRDVMPIKNICQLCSKYDIVLVAYEKEIQNTLKRELKKIKENGLGEEIKIALVVGPEGGLEVEEVKMLQESGARVITLGKRILRTETVCFHVLSILMYELEKEEVGKEGK